MRRVLSAKKIHPCWAERRSAQPSPSSLPSGVLAQRRAAAPRETAAAPTPAPAAAAAATPAAAAPAPATTAPAAMPATATAMSATATAMSAAVSATAAAMSAAATPVSAAAAAAGQLDAREGGFLAVLVEGVERREADVGDFFIAENEGMRWNGIHCRHLGRRSCSRCRQRNAGNSEHGYSFTWALAP